MELNEALIGKVIVKLELSADKETLTFWTNDEKIVLCTENDCCNYVFINSIEGEEFLLNNTIMKIGRAHV